MNFKNLDLYIDSIIKICQKLESMNYTLKNNIKAFYSEDNNKYKALSIEPLITTKNLFIVELNMINVRLSCL